MEFHVSIRLLILYILAESNSYRLSTLSKFLINKEGVPISRYEPTTEPNAMEDDIKKAL